MDFHEGGVSGDFLAVVGSGRGGGSENGDGGGFAGGDFGLAPGEAHGDGAAAGTGNLGFGELGFGPGVGDVFATGDDAAAVFPKPGEQAVVGAFAV